MAEVAETPAPATASQRAMRIPELVSAVLAHLAAPPPAYWRFECMPFWLSSTPALATARLVCRQWAAAGFVEAWRRASTKQLARIAPAERRAAVAAAVEHLRVDAIDGDDGGRGSSDMFAADDFCFPRLSEIYVDGGNDEQAKQKGLLYLLGRCGRDGRRMSDSRVSTDVRADVSSGTTSDACSRAPTPAPLILSSSLKSLTLGLWRFDDPSGVFNTLLLELARLPNLEYLRVYQTLGADVIGRIERAAKAAATAAAAVDSAVGPGHYSDAAASDIAAESGVDQAHRLFRRLGELHASVAAEALPQLLRLVAPPSRLPSLTRLALTIEGYDWQTAAQQQLRLGAVLPLISGNPALQRHLRSLRLSFRNGGCAHLTADDLAGLHRLSRLTRLSVGAWCSCCCGDDDYDDDDANDANGGGGGGDDDDETDAGSGEGVRAARSFTTESLAQLLTHLGPRLQRLSFLVRFPGFSPTTTLSTIGRLCPQLEELLLQGRYSLLSLAPQPLDSSAVGMHDEGTAQAGGPSRGIGGTEEHALAPSQQVLFPKLRTLWLSGIRRSPSAGLSSQPGNSDDNTDGGEDAKSGEKRKHIDEAYTYWLSLSRQAPVLSSIEWSGSTWGRESSDVEEALLQLVRNGGDIGKLRSDSGEGSDDDGN